MVGYWLWVTSIRVRNRHSLLPIPPASARIRLAGPRSHAWGRREGGGRLPQRLLEGLCLAAGADPAARAAGTPRAVRHALVLALKRWSPPVAGTRGFSWAEVTAGGAALEEVDPATMGSRLVPGLYLAGEVLDVDGPIGGFNFQAAFATGHAAGLHL